MGLRRVKRPARAFVGPRRVFAVALPAALILACCDLGTTQVEKAPDPQHPVIQLDERVRLRPLNQTEGQHAIVQQDEFIRRLSPLDRQLRLRTRERVDTAEFLEHARAQVLEWTPNDIGTLRHAVELVQRRLQEADIDLDMPQEIGVVLTTGLEEGMDRPVAYVRGTTIYLSRTALHVDLPHVVAHELFHLYTRTHHNKRPQLYKLIGFEKVPDFRLPKDLEARRITNPDELYFDQKVEVEVQGKPRWVIPVMLAKGAYSEGDFFDHVDVRWTTLDRTPPLLLRAEVLPGLYAKVGRNTDHMLGPEEILAENFAFALERRALPTPDIAVSVLDIIRGRSKPRLSVQDEVAAADAALRTAFEAWLDAQNRGDFRAYSALYAQDFVGRERSGALSFRKKRDQWLAEREAMFAHPRTVKASELEVTVRGNAGMIYFTQHDTSEASEELAPKRIEMVREHGIWRIASEVTLHENLLRSSEGGEFAFVGDLATPYAMLGVVDRRGLQYGERTLDRRNQPGHAVFATIPEGNEPDYAKSWVGLAVRVITDQGHLCTGRVEHLRYIARVKPHHVESLYLQGLVNDRGESTVPLFDREDWSPRPPPDSQILEAIWQSTHAIFVGARIHFDRYCHGKPLVAQPASTPIPKVAKHLDVRPRAQEVITAFRSLPEYAEEQRVCVAAKRCTAVKSFEQKPVTRLGFWEQKPLTVQAFQFQDSNEVLVSVAHFHGGCREYTPNLWAAFGVTLGDENAPIRLRQMATKTAPFWIEVILDRTGSGELEYVVNDGNGALLLIGSDGEVLHRWAPDFQNLEC